MPDEDWDALLLFGGTDLAALRAHGVHDYGVGPVIDANSGAHGVDEHASVDGLGRFVELVYGAVYEVVRAR